MSCSSEDTSQADIIAKLLVCLHALRILRGDCSDVVCLADRA